MNDIKTIAKRLNSLTKDNLELFNYMVDEIITSKWKYEKHIELTLDRLLDFCYDDEVLLLYKKLCRYYLDINPSSTQEYINYYREMYD